MAGLCMLQANNESVKKMAQELLINPNLEIKDTYKDENIQLTQVALKGNKFKSFEQDGIVYLLMAMYTILKKPIIFLPQKLIILRSNFFMLIKIIYCLNC